MALRSSERERPDTSSRETIASLDAQVAGLNRVIDSLTKRVAAMEHREFVYQMAALVTVMAVSIVVAIVIIVKN